MKILFLLLACSLLVSLPTVSSAGDQFKINTSIKPPFSTEQRDGFFDLLLTELFSRIGHKVEFIRLPAERALQMADEGYSDGDVPRVSGLNNRYKNLLEVPEPIIDYNFSAFMRKPVLNDLSWEKLSKQNVGLIIGWKIYETNTPKDSRLTKATSPAQLLELLNGERIDIALYERYAGNYLIRSSNFSSLEECQPSLAVRPMHLYLHKKHAHLVEKISAELRKMKDDGSWQDIAGKTLGK